MRKTVFALAAALLAWFISASAETAIAAPPEQGAEVLEEAIIMEIKNSRKASYRIKRSIKVYRSEADRYAVLTLSENSYRKIKKFSARVLNADGEEIHSYKKNDGRKICGYSGVALYEDVCQFFYGMTATTYPYLVEYEYEIDLNSLFMWPPWIPQSSIPVISSSYTLITPADFEFHHKTCGDLPEPVVTDKGGKRIYQYSLTDIPPYEDEEFVYFLSEQVMSVRFAAGKYQLDDYFFDGSSWESLGQCCYNMFCSCFTISDEQKALIEAIRDSSETQKEICDRLHDALRKSTRYVAIEVGVGRWQPTVAKETFRRGYGDCKDLAAMYVSMLRHVGIEAWTALVYSKGNRLTNENFPSLAFNHAIFYAIVDGDTMWADPTCSHCPMGNLPWRDEDIWALSLDSTGGQIIKTTKPTPQENHLFRKALMEPARGKSVKIDYEFYMTGSPCHELRHYLDYWEQNKLNEYIEGGNFGVSKKLKADSIIVDNEDRFGSPQRIKVAGTLKNTVLTARKKRYVSLACFSHLRECEKVELEERTLPLDLGYPMSCTDSIIFVIPGHWQLEKMPEEVNIESEFGSLQITYSVSDDRFIAVRQRECKAVFAAVEQFPQLIEYLTKVKKALPKNIAFVTN